MNIFENFFRKDLKLNKRWWHRLFQVIFILSFIWALGIAFFDTYQYDKEFKEEYSLRDKFTSELKTLSSYTPDDYTVAEKGKTSGSPKDDTWYGVYKDNTWCSSEMDIEKVFELVQTTGAKVVMITSGYQRLPAKPDEVTEYISNNDISCVALDRYSGENGYSFLEPVEDPNNLYAYSYSPFKTFLNALKYALYVIVAFGIILISYYKIILYIIFGKSK